jgi:hypothetical protein
MSIPIPKLLPRVRVIWIWMVTLLAIFVVGIAWYFMQQVIQYLYALIGWMYPSRVTDNSITFVMSVWERLPILAIIGIGIFVFVRSQKQRGQPQY